MNSVRPASTLGLLASLLLLAACGGSDGPTVVAPGEGCFELIGSGQTTGHVRSLVGSGDFTFDGVSRSAHVGVYLNRLHDIEHGRKKVNIVYQFTWPNGDMFLTENDVILWPHLQEDHYEFEANLFVKSTQGIFEGLENTHILDFKAELVFGDILPMQGLGAVDESFTMTGTVCLPEG